MTLALTRKHALKARRECHYSLSGTLKRRNQKCRVLVFEEKKEGKLGGNYTRSTADQKPRSSSGQLLSSQLPHGRGARSSSPHAPRTTHASSLFWKVKIHRKKKTLRFPVELMLLFAVLSKARSSIPLRARSVIKCPSIYLSLSISDATELLLVPFDFEL